LFEDGHEIGSQHHSDLCFFDASRRDIHVVSAIEANAYPETEMRRTMAVIKKENFEKPYLLDIIQIYSDKEHQYDLPFYFMGQVLQVNFEYDIPESLSALGQGNGYQHLYLEGKGTPPSANTKFSWMNSGRFYTLTSATGASDTLLFTRLGANDPEFNLRRDAAFMIRRVGVRNTIFAAVIEPHGSYSPVSENAINSNSNIADLKIVYDDEDYTAVSIEDLEGGTSIFVLSNSDVTPTTAHKLNIGDRDFAWRGPYHYADL
jgi:hypothetical protein